MWIQLHSRDLWIQNLPVSHSSYPLPPNRLLNLLMPHLLSHQLFHLVSRQSVVSLYPNHSSHRLPPFPMSSHHPAHFPVMHRSQYHLLMPLHCPPVLPYHPLLPLYRPPVLPYHPPVPLHHLPTSHPLFQLILQLLFPTAFPPSFPPLSSPMLPTLR